jgi:hypothetical protein
MGYGISSLLNQSTLREIVPYAIPARKEDITEITAFFFPKKQPRYPGMALAG